MKKLFTLVLALAACDRMGPRGDDDDTTPSGPDAAVNADGVLPAGTAVPHVSTNDAMVAQIRLNDGINDNQLAMAGGVLVRSTGKAGGATVMFWNFGTAPMSGNFPVVSPVYVLVDANNNPIDHLELLDSIPGDPRYSQVRRIMYVPVTPAYKGEIIASIPALGEAIDRGLVGEPVSAGLSRNMPVLPPDTKLELGGSAAPLEPSEVYALGHRVTVFRVGSTQPLRNGNVPTGQVSLLVSGVPTGTPPVMSTTPDTLPVFQYTAPTAPPTDTPNYTPLTTQVDVRLAAGIAPAAIMSDAQLFRRMPAATGSINGYFVDAVSSYTVTTTVTNRQLQFQEGAP